MGIEKQKITVIEYDSTDSTNSRALELVKTQAVHGMIIRAASQTGGRGRGEKNFSSPAGGLYMSLVLRPHIASEFLPLITLAAGVACAAVIEQLSGIFSFVKWPNDLYVDSRKLAGILTETASPPLADYNKAPVVIVGIGVNVNSQPSAFPLSLRDDIVSLAHLTGRLHDLDDFMFKIAERIIALVAGLDRHRKNILTQWRERDFLLGKPISWNQLDGRVIKGVGLGLADDGRYRLRDAAGVVHHVLAGHLRPL